MNSFASYIERNGALNAGASALRMASFAFMAWSFHKCSGAFYGAAASHWVLIYPLALATMALICAKTVDEDDSWLNGLAGPMQGIPMACFLVWSGLVAIPHLAVLLYGGALVAAIIPVIWVVTLFQVMRKFYSS